MSILRNIVCPKWGTGLRELGMSDMRWTVAWIGWHELSFSNFRVSVCHFYVSSIRGSNSWSSLLYVDGKSCPKEFFECIVDVKNSAYCLFVYVSNFRSSDPRDRILVIPLFRIVLASQKGEDEAWRFTLHLSTQLLFWGFNCFLFVLFPLVVDVSFTFSYSIVEED